MMNSNPKSQSALATPPDPQGDQGAAQVRQTRQQFSQTQGPLSFELGKAVRGLPALYTRLLAGTITLAVLGTLTWAALSQQEQVARATGKTVPLQQVQAIKAPIAGEIDQVMQENQQVEPGQVLFTLKTDHLHQEIDHIDRQMIQIETLIKAVKHTSLQSQRHQSKALLSELEGINRQLVLVQNDLENQPRLVFSSQEWLLARSTREALKEQARMRMEQAGIQKNLDQLYLQDQQTRHGTLAQVEQLQLQQIELRQQRDQLQHQIDQSTIKAPMAGTAFNVKTTRGQVNVQPGTELLTISPAGVPLVMQVKFNSKEAPLIHTGMKANVKLSALDSQSVGVLKGTVQEVSPDSMEKEGEEPYYQAIITLDKASVDRLGKTHRLKPGMGGTAEVITGEKSILGLLIEPIAKTLEDSLK